jgi:hypothetical protein
MAAKPEETPSPGLLRKTLTAMIEPTISENSDPI